MYIIDNDYLAHHGIKGQKWGERRFQNEDGSLTPAGEERYRKEQKKAGMRELKLERKLDRIARREEKKEYRADVKKIQKLGGYKGLSDSYYHDLKEEKGKYYADQVYRKAKRQMAAKNFVKNTVLTVASVGALVVAGKKIGAKYDALMHEISKSEIDKLVEEGAGILSRLGL